MTAFVCCRCAVGDSQNHAQPRPHSLDLSRA